jgi:VanZ family protein
MTTPATRHTLVRWLPFVVAVVAVTAVSWSSSVMQWWDVQSSPATSSLPSAANSVLESRANSSNADVHVALWFVATLALVWAMRHRPWRALVVAAIALWAYTGVVEVGQRWVSDRTSQWIDVVGNGLGIVTGLAVGCGAIAAWRRVRGSALQPGETQNPGGVQKRSGWSARSGAI